MGFIRYISQFTHRGNVIRRRQYVRNGLILAGCLLFASFSIFQLKSGSLSSELQRADALSSEGTSRNPQLGSPNADPVGDGPLLDAWMYPDAPGAMKALKTHNNINAIRAEFLHINDDGSLEQINQDESAPNGYSTENVATIKKYSREQYITVSGTMQGTEQAMKNGRTIAGIVALAHKTGFNVELDWEEYGQWTPEYYQSYKHFVAQLADKLHDSELTLAVDGPPIYDASSQAWYQWKYEEVAPIVDSVVMMVYDNQYDMGVGTSIAPKSWSMDCMEWLKRTAGDKAVAGVAAYGYSGDKRSGRIAVNSSDHIRRRIGQQTVTRNADGELVATSGNTFYSYADAQTMDVRLDQVKQSGISRLSVWSLGDNPWFE